MNTIALPFCKTSFEAPKPKPAGYPKSLKTLGDHIRTRRMDLGRLQKDVAKLLCASVLTVCNWETNRTSPAERWVPRIIDFLRNAPCVVSSDLKERTADPPATRGVSRSRLGCATSE
jgi:DNA-binding transcriptional regulator YiaG